MTTSRFSISASPLHGVGVFADCSVKKGELVGVMRMVEVGKLDDLVGLPTVGVVHRGYVYVPEFGFPLWAVNHSTTPNITADRWGNVVALEDINNGEELTVLYYKEPK